MAVMGVMVVWVIVNAACYAGEANAGSTVEELEHQLSDPESSISAEWVATLAEKASESATLSAIAAGQLNVDHRTLYEQEKDDTKYVRCRLLKFAYAEALRGSLAYKQGAARASSALGVFELYFVGDIPRRWLDRSQIDEVSARVRRGFAVLPEAEQLRVLDWYWRRLGEASLVPALRRRVEEAPEPDPKLWDYEQQGTLPNVAIRRIYEVAPEQARELVVRDLNQERPPLSTHLVLPDKPIPELDDVLMAHLFPRDDEESEDVERWTRLVDRYGSSSYADFARNVLEFRLVSESTTGCVGLLSYVLKHDPESGVELVNRVLDDRPGNGLYRDVLAQLSRQRLAPELEEIAIARLDDPMVDVASDAVYVIGQFAHPAGLQALKDRLTRWRDEQLRIKQTLGAFIETLEQDCFDDLILVTLCDNRKWIAPLGELLELQKLCLTEQAKKHIALYISCWTDRLRISFYPDPLNSEFKYPDWTEGSNGPPSGTDLFYVCGRYSAASRAELKELLARFPRGTVFALPKVSSDPDEYQRFFDDLRQHLEKHGMQLVAADR